MLKSFVIEAEAGLESFCRTTLNLPKWLADEANDADVVRTSRSAQFSDAASILVREEEKNRGLADESGKREGPEAQKYDSRAEG